MKFPSSPTASSVVVVVVTAVVVKCQIPPSRSYFDWSSRSSADGRIAVLNIRPLRDGDGGTGGRIFWGSNDVPAEFQTRNDYFSYQPERKPVSFDDDVIFNPLPDWSNSLLRSATGPLHNFTYDVIEKKSKKYRKNKERKKNRRKGKRRKSKLRKRNKLRKSAGQLRKKDRKELRGEDACQYNNMDSCLRVLKDFQFTSFKKHEKTCNKRKIFFDCMERQRRTPCDPKETRMGDLRRLREKAKDVVTDGYSCIVLDINDL